MKQGKNLTPSSGSWRASGRLWRLFSCALIAVSALFLQSCKTTAASAGERRDSIRTTSSVQIESVSAVEEARLDTVAWMVLTRGQIDSLPPGAAFSVQTGQATASLRKQAGGGLALSAQGIIPAKVTTRTTARSDGASHVSSHYKPPDGHSNDVKSAPKWYEDGFVIASLLFGVLSITAVIWAGRSEK